MTHIARALPPCTVLPLCATLLVCAALSTIQVNPAQAQSSGAAAADGKTLFANQCAACHADAKGEPTRIGPDLYGVVGRKAGSEPGFPYSSGFAKADFTWDDAHLNKWLTDPQTVIPGAVMMYQQARPEVRTAIIQYLSTQK